MFLLLVSVTKSANYQNLESQILGLGRLKFKRKCFSDEEPEKTLIQFQM